MIALCAGCGGGGDSSNSTPTGGGPTPPSSSNVVDITVGPVVAGASRYTPNILTVTLTLCSPGSTTNCQTIPNVQVDTMSYGLRLAYGAASQFLGSLPQALASNGAPLAECATFADSMLWGSIRTADIQIGGKQATAVPIQIAGDMPASSLPSACSNGLPQQDTPAQLGSNGILGIGTSPTDCGQACLSASKSHYYACTGANCVATGVALAQQVTNPVTKFATDNNGVIVRLPSVPPTGQALVTGQLYFGIGTQSNNALNAARKLPTNPFGDLSGTVGGNAISLAFLDSGSNAYFFGDIFQPALPVCDNNTIAPGFYCPPSDRSLSATLIGSGNTSAPITVTVTNATSLDFANNHAFDNLGGSISINNMLDIGLPFFYGRTVYYGYPSSTGSGASSPYVAF